MKKIFSDIRRSFISLFGFDGDPQVIELLIIAVLILFVGTEFYHFEEGWSLLNSFYFSVTT